MEINRVTPRQVLSIPSTTAIQIGELVGRMIRDADARNAAATTPTLADLHAHTDAMRDLREALVELGVLAL